ncbi:hypothetical protein M0805_004760 [Coniferiporia weirii]|nr:hypothetical protein M0805_004760 [Coniferiporia weirii]
MQDNMIAAGPHPVATPPPRSAVRETEMMALRQTGEAAYPSSVRDSLLGGGTCVTPAPPTSPRYSKQRHSRPQSHIQHAPHQSTSSTSTSVSASSAVYTRDSLPYPGSGSDSDTSSPDSDVLDSNSGSDHGMSCPSTPAMHACLPPHNNDNVLKESRQERRQSAASDDTSDADFKIHSSDLVLGTPLYLPRASLPPLPASPSIPAYSPTTASFPDADLERLATLDLQSLDALDNVDNRPDADAIIAMRLARNSLLPHVLIPDSLSRGGPTSALTLETESMRSNSWYGYDSGVGGVPDLSRLSVSNPAYDAARASTQTYGSSVLTYGSRASRLFDPETPRVEELSSQDAGRERGNESILPYDIPRPSHPLPWNPRPSALVRISSAPAAGWRPLPPTPAGKPDVSAGARRPRPLPKTPAGTDSPHSDTSGNESGSSSASINVIPLPPIPVEAPLRLSRIRQSTMEKRHSLMDHEQVPALAVGSADNVLPESNDGGDRDARGRGIGSISRSLKRTVSVLSRATSMYSVPEIDELLRILDENDTNSMEESMWFDDASVVNLQVRVSERPGVGGEDEALPTPTTPTPARTTIEEDGKIDTEGALTRPRSSTSVSRDSDAHAAAAPGKIGSDTGLPTPAATPRTSPDREAEPLPRLGPKSLAPSQTTAQPQLLSPMRGQEQEQVSPVPSAFSLSRFPLPPTALVIPGPSALGAAEMPIPSARGAPPSPGAHWARSGTTPAERATLPGMDTYGVKTNVPQDRTTASPPRPTQPRHVNAPSQLSHTRTRDEIADLKRRIFDLPVGVPLLGQPMRLRRRAQSVTGGVPQTTKYVPAARKHPHHTNLRPPAINVKVANSLPPPSAFGFSVGAPATATSAPAHGSEFQHSAIDPPSGASTILYTTPSVPPLRIRRTASQASARKVDPTLAPAAAKSGPIQLPPPASVPRSAEAAVTTFSAAEAAAKNRSPPSAFSGTGTRSYRSTSLSAGPCSATTPTVEPLRFRNSKLGPRRRGSVVSTTSTRARPTSSVGNDDQCTPANFMTLDTPIAEATELDDNCPTGRSVWTVETDRSEQDTFRFSNRVSLDPTLVDMIKGIAGASKEERRGSLHTIASSVNTRHGLAPPSSAPFDDGDKSFVDIDEEPAEVKSSYRTSANSGHRKSKRRSTNSVKRRASSRSVAAVRAAIRALPDPSTFPVPSSSGSTATDGSAAAAAADFTNFMRPSPLPKLRVVTKFKGGSVLVPASQAPLSAVSTKSTASCRSIMSTYSSGVAKPKRVSVLGRRRMNRLTLTDPRSPMADAAVAAATLVSRVRQKRAALAQYGPSAGAQRRIDSVQGGGMIGHRRTGSIGTLRSKLKMTGGSFFGSGSRVY